MFDLFSLQHHKYRRGVEFNVSTLGIKFYFLLVICFLIFLLVGCQPKDANSKTIQPQVKIVGVPSGNTLNAIAIGSQSNLNSQVRLIGIDAPDRRQRPWGEDSSRRLRELIGDKPVKLEFDLKEKDRFGRMLAYAWQDKILLNEELVKEGYALFVPRSPNHKYDLRLERAQQYARLMGNGIWNPEKPMRLTPGEFRRIYR